MENALFLTGSLSLLIWLYLLFLRGRFWQADQRLDPGRNGPGSWPAVAALMAVGDDPDAIEDTLPALLAQEYSGPFHVFVVAAGGRDDTAAEAAWRAAQAAGTLERLSVLRAETPPAGWSQRAWALAQAQEQAAAKLPALRYLWLTEPWIGHRRHSLRDLVAQAEGGRCDLVSLLPLSACEGILDRLLAPAFAFFFQAFHPISRVNDPLHTAAAASPGCALVGVDALRTAGGLAALKDVPAIETALAARVKAAAPQSGRKIWFGLGEGSTSVRPGDEWTMLRELTLASAAAPVRTSPLRLAAGIGCLAFACLAPPVVFLWALVAGFFLDIDQFLVTFLALLVACGAWAAMAFAAWPTFELFEQEEWRTLLLPLAALAQALLMLAQLPRLLGRVPRPGKAPAATEGGPRPDRGAAKVEPRLDLPARTSAAPPAEDPRAKGTPVTAGHALRQRVARS